jgi:predicted AAA+ superfamily ATPase
LQQRFLEIEIENRRFAGKPAFPRSRARDTRQEIGSDGSEIVSDDVLKAILKELKRLADATERAAGGAPAPILWDAADCFVWNPERQSLTPVKRPNRVDLELIRGVDHVKAILHENTDRFAEGFAANNVLLWGARGMGKSSLVKAIHAAINEARGTAMKLVEVHREDIQTLPVLMDILKTADFRVILFCDDLSFDNDDTSYKSLKAALDGGVEGRPENVIFYATSNRRHLLPRNMIENEQSTAINPSEAVEEKVSLSDRFGLWLGFHKCSQDDYLAMVDGYADYFKLAIDREKLHFEALEWATTRGSRSGRVAWQYIQDLAGRLKTKI